MQTFAVIDALYIKPAPEIGHTSLLSSETAYRFSDAGLPVPETDTGKRFVCHRLNVGQ